MKYWLAMVLILSMGTAVYAGMPDSNKLKEVYPEATVTCTACHPAGNFKELNSYGKDYLQAGCSIEGINAIADKDSDGDTIENAKEIMAGTNPGDAESK